MPCLPGAIGRDRGTGAAEPRATGQRAAVVTIPRCATEPGAAVELADRGEQRLAGHDVDVDAGLLIVPVLVPERRQCASRTS
jgi:hypothetical protein